MTKVDLSLNSNREYYPGKRLWYRFLWIVVEAVTLLNPVFVPSGIKCRILRAFGAQIGRHVIIKPNLHVKHPWRLSVGDNVWLGYSYWIDYLVSVTIGDNVCISQVAYI